MLSRFSTVFGLALAAAVMGACQEASSPLTSTDAAALARGSDDRIELNATFNMGDAKARFRSRGNQQELQVQVEDLTPGAAIDVLVGGILVGTQTVDALGNINLNHNTNVDGPFPAGFAVAAGTTVIAQTADGTVVAKGAF